MQVFGQLQNASLEVLSSDPSTTVQGRVWFNSTTSKLMLDDGTTKSAVLRNDQNCVFGTNATPASNVRFNRAGAAHLQIVTGNDTTAEGTASSSLAQVGFRNSNYTYSGKPSAGNAGRTIYISDRSGLYVDNGTAWQPVGSGGGGSKNYLGTVNGTSLNGDFELAATTGWSLFTTTLTGTLPTGTISAGAASVGTFAVVSSGQLAGTYSLSTASAAAWSSGQGFLSDLWTIDAEDISKVLTFKFYYKCASGATNANFSGTSSNSFAVYVWDTANSAWIQPAGVYNLVQNSGAGICTGTFQTPSNATSFRFAIVCINSTAGAVSMLWDDFSCGPQTFALGPAVSDWTSTTVTLTNGTVGTATVNKAEWRRVGDTMEFYWQVRNTGAGTAGSGTYLITLPNGASFDTNKISPSTTAGPGEALGPVQMYDGSAVVYMGMAYAYDNTHIAVYLNGAPWGSANLPVSTATMNWTITANCPISGWSSNVVMSNDTDTRVISFSGSKGSTQAVTANTTDITFTAVNDRAGAWGGSTYTVPVSGDYVVAYSGMIDNSTTADTFNFYLNGSLYRNGSTSGSSIYASGTVLMSALSAGNTISLRTNNTTTLGASGQLTIYRLSGPAVTAATESVNMRYGSSATTLSSTLATVTYATKAADSHSGYSGGVYTIPVSGKYQVNASLAVSGTFALNNTVDLQIQQNGTAVAEDLKYAGGAVTALQACASDIVTCVAGDLIRVQASSTATTPTIVSGTTKAFLSISRVGN